ncbi:MAG: hypothetical protein AAF633_20730, partial [Chloroflexota bacterium]
MVQIQTRNPEYWSESAFEVTDDDIENIYQHLIEAEEPQTISTLAEVIIESRVNVEKQTLQRRLEGRKVYQPRESYELGTAIVFPTLHFAQGEVTSIRVANNPQHGQFQAIEVTFESGKVAEYAASLDISHPLNDGNGLSNVVSDEVDAQDLSQKYGRIVETALDQKLQDHEDFTRLAQEWFIKSLFSDVNVGHLHLAEAVLEINGGGPLPTDEILIHLDMDASTPQSVKRFSLNYALLNDDRFSEVAPPGEVSWFLKRLMPTDVQETPERLEYEPMSFDRALFGSQLNQIERELDDEWSDIESSNIAQSVKVVLTYAHKASGTLPFSSRVRNLFPLGVSQTQLVTLVDDTTQAEYPAWVVNSGRYITGLGGFYETNNVPAGSFINLIPTGKLGRVMIGIDRRKRDRKEWIRLGSVEDGGIHFELKKLNIGCDYDDLMVLDTESVAAIDALF